MRRRDLIGVLGGAAAWPFIVRAQPANRLRRVVVLLGVTPDDPDAQPRVLAFEQGLRDLGWISGRNLDIRLHWPPSTMDGMRDVAREVVRAGADMVLATGTGWVEALLPESRLIPIVFVLVSDPVGRGFVTSLARPGGNITGFSNLEPSMAGKWLEILWQFAPQMKRCVLMFHPDVGQGASFLQSFELAAKSLGVTAVGAPVRSDDEIAAAIPALNAAAGGGLVVMSDQFLAVKRALLVKTTAAHNVPAIYPSRNFVAGGGLVSYGVSAVDLYRRSASYIDRILRGERTSELPVQRPIKFELVINLKTARTLGLKVPTRLLTLADEAIE